MTQTKSEYQIRIEKVAQMRERGINPYAAKYDKKHSIVDIVKEFDTKKDFRDINDIIATPKKEINIAGRVMLYRTHGKLSFVRLQDESGIIQVMLHTDNCTLATKNTLPISAYKFFEKYVDVGDFIGVHGEVFRTHKGELTIFAPKFTFLSKSLRPLGDKFHGISNQDMIYRQRYLDTILDEETRKRFVLRSEFLRVIRQFYYEQKFIEVETPILGYSASGAAAAPFVTHHHEMDVDMYLRISPETALKKMTVGMFEKVFEVAKDFRNEGSDPSHHQEFTMIEHYAAYRDYKRNMDFTEELFVYIFKHIPSLKRIITVKDKQGNAKEVNFGKKRERLDYVEQIKKDSGIDVSKYGIEDEEKLRSDIKKAKLQREGLDQQGTITIIDYLYKKVTRPKIIGPTFIYNYPKTMQPLARVSDKDKNIVEQRQLVINGREVIKSYSELVDPIVQQQNFDEQSTAIAKGDTEATKGDDDFVLAMEYGMPPQSGRGMGVDRILSLLTEQENVRDVIYFPMMKPLQSSGVEGNETKDPGTIKMDSSLRSEGQSTVTLNASEEYKNIPTKESAHTLAKKYLTDTLQHCEQVAKVMQYFAKKLGQDEDVRYITGLLHDVDRDHIGKDPEKHIGEAFEKIVSEIDLPDELIADIRSHYTEKTGVPLDLLIRKYLISVDELSGFLYAYSLLRPEGFIGMEAKGVRKRMKDKKFAAGVNREHMTYCEKLLGIPLEEFIPQVIEAIQ